MKVIFASTALLAAAASAAPSLVARQSSDGNLGTVSSLQGLEPTVYSSTGTSGGGMYTATGGLYTVSVSRNGSMQAKLTSTSNSCTIQLSALNIQAATAGGGPCPDDLILEFINAVRDPSQSGQSPYQILPANGGNAGPSISTANGISITSGSGGSSSNVTISSTSSTTSSSTKSNAAPHLAGSQLAPLAMAGAGALYALLV